ncbi:alpha/beta hydrolase domain-containing protein [Nocardioides psychrotolerans]|uniref:alpha/beta hydrolase domain-containing protein n=1 Tax=Nocardioides psychrotolerans TaxID=1005945 RepID=UPI0031383355
MAQRRADQLDRRGDHRQGGPGQGPVLTTLRALPPGDAGIASARPGPDLAEWGYTETEHVASGTAVSYRADDLPADGHWSLEVDDTADFATRVLVRSPAPERASGTLVVEWLNVSSGQDAAPGWTFYAEEVVRRGHAYAAVSAQHAGVEGGLTLVAIGGRGSPGLRGGNPERYADLTHPGDAFCYDVFTSVARAVAESLGSTCVLATGESQSAFALTSYADGVQPITGLFDGFLIHSRGGTALPLGRAGEGVRLEERLRGVPTRLRTDLDVPVLVVQTETDLFGYLDFLPARQPDHDLLRVWEVAGTAHADKHVIGDFEDFLGCSQPVNRGQQVFVVRAALHHLERWARGGEAAPQAPPLDVVDGAFVLDDVGNVTGGVRTPAVDAPVEVLSGTEVPGSSALCRLFGSSAVLPADRIGARWRDADHYRSAYAAAAERAVALGFVLAEDREALLADERSAQVPQNVW